MEIQNISPDALEALFGEDTKTEQTPPTHENEDKKEVTDSVVINQNDGYSGILNIDIDTLEDEEVNSTEEKTPAKPKKEEVPVVESNLDTTVLKNTVDFMIQKGYWKDFEGREDLDIDEETYAELASKQFESKLNESLSEILDSTGDYGKAIIAHVRDGGNPDDVIDIFKEQKEIQSIDTNTDNGKALMVSKYYSEILGWKPERVEKHLKRIIEDDDLDIESSEIEEKYNEYYQEQLQNIELEREQAKLQRLEGQQRFASSINETLTELNYSDSEKRKITKALLDVKKLPNGQVTTDFTLRFSEIQKDPKRLIKLVDYVMDEEKFINKIQKTSDTNAAAKSFNFIKGNSTASKSKGSSHTDPASKNSNLDFSSLLK